MRPTRVAPLAIFLREDAALAARRRPRTSRPRCRIRRAKCWPRFEQRGASFFTDLVRATGRLASEVEDGLWELVAAGLVTADGFENLRSLIDPKRRRGEGRGRSARPGTPPDAGRCSNSPKRANDAGAVRAVNC